MPPSATMWQMGDKLCRKDNDDSERNQRVVQEILLTARTYHRAIGSDGHQG